MTNILLVSNYSSDTGYAWWLMEHFWLIVSAKLPTHSNAYLVYPRVTTISQQLADSDINIVELDFSADNSIKVKAALKFVKDKKIRTVYFTDRPYFSLFYFLLRLNGIKTIIVHDHTPGDRPPTLGFKGFIKSIRNRLPLFTSDLVINVSPLMRERSILNGRIPPEKCISVQNGLSIDNQSTKNKEQPNLRKDLGIDMEATLVVCSSRLHTYKNVHFAIKVFASALETTPENAHLIVIGDGPDEDQLETLAQNQACKDRIHFLGFREDVKNILPQCQLAMHCSKGEGFSLSILEFMWSGLPVLVPDVPSVCQAITNETTGLVYANNSLEDAQQKLKQLLRSRVLCEKMGQVAKQEVLEKYTMQSTDRQFTEALKKVGI